MDSVEQRLLSHVDGVNPDGVSGWARWEGSTEPVDVVLVINGTDVGQLRADRYRSDLRAMRPDGAFAFLVTFSTGVDLLDCVAPNAVVEVRELTTGEVLHGGTSVWQGRAPDGTAGLVAPSGERLRLIKGVLHQPLSDQSEQIRRSTAVATRRVVERAAAAGFTLMLGYGSLLGAVRTGEMIGHDDDVDLVHLSAATDMLSAAEELIALRDWLRGEGHWAQDVTSGQLHIAPYGATGIGVDVFAAWFEESRLHLCFTVVDGPTIDEVLPLSEVTLEGERFPAPRHPEVLLESIYGATWATPDPGFVWQLPRDVWRFFRPMHNYSRSTTLNYWSEFYGRAAQLIRPDASDFATVVCQRITADALVVDIGCGSGRDSLYFAAQGIRVLGLDGAAESIAWCRDRADSLGIDRDGIEFMTTDLSTAVDVATAIRYIRERRVGSTLLLYARFLLHAIDEPSELFLLRLARETLVPGDEWWLEFRTLADQGAQTVHGDHYRRYIDLNHFIQRARDEFDLVCTYQVEGQGLAVYGSEDPHVARVCLTVSPPR